MSDKPTLPFTLPPEACPGSLMPVVGRYGAPIEPCPFCHDPETPGKHISLAVGWKPIGYVSGTEAIRENVYALHPRKSAPTPPELCTAKGGHVYEARYNIAPNPRWSGGLNPEAAGGLAQYVGDRCTRCGDWRARPSGE